MDLEISRSSREVNQYFGVAQHEVGDWENGEIIVEGVVPVRPHLRGANGGLRSGALLAMADHVGGLCGGLAALPDGWVVSTNLSMRVGPLDHVGPLRLRSEVLRRGRAAVINSIRVTDDGAGGATVADAVLTSAVLVPETGAPTWQRPAGIMPDALESAPPFVDWLETRDLPDGVELSLRDELRNPWGIMHGAVVAAVVDLAGERVVSARTGGGPVATTDAVVHFLSPGRVGPITAHARPIGVRADGHVVRTELRDRGASDRLIAVAITTVRPLDHS